MSLEGTRTVIERGDANYPESLENVDRPPHSLYVIGNADVLEGGLAVIGARRATPYGKSCAHRFARIAAEKGICIISGGARGCDSEAHRAALAASGPTLVVLGGGCDEVYPAENFSLFQRVIDEGGAVMSEHAWNEPPLPAYFRMRNRLIAGLSQAVLIVEAGVPSGTFSTADNALDYGKDVYVVPGAITSHSSRGSNRLLLQGATPIVDDESFEDALFNTFGMLKAEGGETLDEDETNPIMAALRAEPLTMDELLEVAKSSAKTGDAQRDLMEALSLAEALGKVKRHPDGRWGPVIRT